MWRQYVDIRPQLEIALNLEIKGSDNDSITKFTGDIFNNYLRIYLSPSHPPAILGSYYVKWINHRWVQAPEKPFSNADFSWDGGMDLLDLDLTPAKPAAGYGAASAAPVVDTSAWGAWWEGAGWVMLERFQENTIKITSKTHQFLEFQRFFTMPCVSVFLRIRICDERLPRWTCLDWDDIQNERKKVVHGVKSGGLFEL